MVLICTSVMTNDGKHLIICLLAICISPIGNVCANLLLIFQFSYFFVFKSEDLLTYSGYKSLLEKCFANSPS